MSDGTKIEWTDATWNPIRARIADAQDWEMLPTGWHCERVSPGCQHCYAETLNEKRFGTGLPYNRASRDRVTIEVDEAALVKPLHWRKARRVFVCSMTDLFGEWVKDEQIDRVFAVMALCPQHTFQVLTKRPERMRAYVAETPRRAWDGDLVVMEDCPWPLPNVWLGVSAEDQRRWDERVPVLLQTPAAVRFVSAEPLLGPIDLGLDQVLFAGQLSDTEAAALKAKLEETYRGPGKQFLVLGLGEKREPLLHWVIVGGESGPGARSCDVGWIRSLVGECQAAGVSVFVKQLGAKPYGRIGTGVAAPGIRGRGRDAAVPDLGMVNWAPKLKDSKGGDMSEWPADLRVREFPGAPSPQPSPVATGEGAQG